MLRHHTLISVALVLLCAAALLWPVPDGAWHMDDLRTIVRNPAVQSPGSLGEVLGFERFRPLLSFTFAANAKLGGEDPRGFLRTNVFIHIANLLLLLALLGRSLRREQLWVATAAVLIAAVHPLGVEAVAYVSARSTALATTFLLAGLWALAARPGKATWIALYLGALVLGTLVKEIGVLLPALGLALDFCLLRSRDPEGFSWRLRRLHAPLLVAGLLLGLWRVGVLSDTGRGALADNIGLHLLSLRRLVLPWALGLQAPVFAPRPPPGSDTTFAYLLALALVAGVCVGLWQGWRRRPEVGFFGAAAIIVYAPNLLGATHDSVMGHRFYPLLLFGVAPLAATAGAAALTAAQRAHPQARIAVAIVLGALLLRLGIMGRAHVERFATEATLWHSVVAREPWNGRAWGNISALRLQAGDLAGAREAAESALALAPEGATAQHNMGLLYEHEGNDAKAAEHYHRALRAEPRQPETLQRLGLLQLRRSRYLKARETFERAVISRPHRSDLRVLAAREALRWGQYGMAVKHLERATRVAWRDPEADTMLEDARKLKKRHGPGPAEIDPDECQAGSATETYLKERRPDKALRCAMLALSLPERTPRAHFDMGRALMGVGWWTDAARELLRWLQHDATHPEHRGMYVAAVREGRDAEAAVRAALDVAQLRPFDPAPLLEALAWYVREKSHQSEVPEQLLQHVRYFFENAKSDDGGGAAALNSVATMLPHLPFEIAALSSPMGEAILRAAQAWKSADPDARERAAKALDALADADTQLDDLRVLVAALRSVDAPQ